MASCTIFRNFDPAESKSLIQIGNEIKSGKYKLEIEEFRYLIQQGKKEEAALKKKQLVAFSPSVILKDSRHIENIEKYNGFVHLDFDKLSIDKLKSTFKVLTEIPYTFMCFISPSGKGLKVFIELDSKMEDHDVAYQVVKKYYEKATGLKADNRCKDIARLCFMSYDPDLYKNISNEKFIIKMTDVPSAPFTSSLKAEPDLNAEVDLNITMQFQQQIEFTNRKVQYIEGDRNNYIYSLASNCNRAGIPQENTTELSFLYFDLPEREIRASVQSAYKHHTHEFGKFANLAKSAKLQPEIQPLPEDEDPIEDYLKTTPTIPDSVYENLPSLLKEGARVFTDKRKRDVFFTAAIAILSGCLPKVTGVYFQERVYPHLNTLIIAPPASGKGVLKNAKRLGDKYHQKILNESNEAQKTFEKELAIFKQRERNFKKGEPCPEKPTPPAFKILFIPADSSKAKMLAHLKANDGMGIICESEADTMSGTNKQDWGDYSTILRSAFHHETISISRKGENQYDEILEPRLAVTMSGTPGQVPRLLSSAEDGLFSRILYYAYKNEIKWQDPSPKSTGVVFNDHFDALSLQVLDMISFLELSPTNVELTVGQWERINTEFPVMLSDVVTFTSEDAAGVVYRLALIFFRICMIFSALQKFENGDMSSTILCTDEDFDSILQIVQTYLAHSLLMFNNLPKQNDSMRFIAGDNKRKFFNSLPTEFTRKEAVKRSKEFELSIRTVDDILKLGTGASLTKVKMGHYRKI